MPLQNLSPDGADGCMPPVDAGQDGRRERGGQSPADHRPVTWRSGEHEAASAAAHSTSCRGASPSANIDGYQRCRAPTAGHGPPNSVPVR